MKRRNEHCQKKKNNNVGSMENTHTHPKTKFISYFSEREARREFCI